jgi:hypothetical protein
LGEDFDQPTANYLELKMAFSLDLHRPRKTLTYVPEENVLIIQIFVSFFTSD